MSISVHRLSRGLMMIDCELKAERIIVMIMVIVTSNYYDYGCGY
jgi:hypothetical protein